MIGSGGLGYFLINITYKELNICLSIFLDQQLNVTSESVIFQPIGVLSIALVFMKQISMLNLNPGTTFIFRNREKVQYLNINEVNRLQPSDMLTS